MQNTNDWRFLVLIAEVQYITEGLGRPIYRASSAGRNAAFTLDRDWQVHNVKVRDARSAGTNFGSEELGLPDIGFKLIKHISAVNTLRDDDKISSAYETEIETILKTLTGASRVHIFDHTRRANDPEVREQKQFREPATMVHNDYTQKSGHVCLRENLGDDAERLAKGRFQIINLWRPLVNLVQNFPLVFCDARTIETADIVPTERRSPTHIGEILLATFNPRHRWYYFSNMTGDEVLAFKTFDSENPGQNPGSIHTSICIPDAPPDAPPRESIETRAFVFYE
jgi:hypothetical protein